MTEALYTLHRSGSVIMLIYEKVKETTAHLPSDGLIKNRHLEVTIWSSMKNVIFTSPIPLYSVVFPYLRVHVHVIWSMKNQNFTQKMHKRLRKKETSQIVHNICKPPYCHMVSALNSLCNAMKIFLLKSSRISYFYKNIDLTLSYIDQ